MLFCEMIHSSLKMTSNNFFCSSSIGKRIHIYNVKAYVQNTNHTLALCCRILFIKSLVYSIPNELQNIKKNFFLNDIHHMVLRRVQMLLTKSSINQNYVEARMYVPLTEIFFSTPFLCTYFIKKTLYMYYLVSEWMSGRYFIFQHQCFNKHITS